MNLYKKLVSYRESDYYPFHMPGHKRNTKVMEEINPYEIDITEIDGFDNLHEPEEIMKEEMGRAARLFGAEETYFLVNGSSCGLLAAISACTHHGEKILMARNCHKSVYNGIFINELQPVYLYPQADEEFGINLGILPEDVDNLLKEHPDCKTVVLTSPTYEGVVSDIKKIAGIVHSYNAILIVDEAHGAHFPFSGEFPASAVDGGADIVIQSIHKTLPALTQTALAQVQGERVARGRLRQFLSVFQSSSPSYVLIAGISRCMDFLERDKEAFFETYTKQLRDFYRKAEGLTHIYVLKRGEYKGFERDSSKLVISVKNTSMTGRQLYDILLERYHLQMEMAKDTYVLGMTSVLDSKEGFSRLWRALEELDKGLEEKEAVKEIKPRCQQVAKRRQCLTSYEAALRKTEWIALDRAKGRICGAYIYLYPPGIPLLCPGEEIDGDCLEQIWYYKRTGLIVHGISEDTDPMISVISEE